MLLRVVAVGAEGAVARGGGGAEAVGERARGGGRVRLGGVVDGGCVGEWSVSVSTGEGQLMEGGCD